MTTDELLARLVPGLEFVTHFTKLPRNNWIGLSKKRRLKMMATFRAKETFLAVQFQNTHESASAIKSMLAVKNVFIHFERIVVETARGELTLWAGDWLVQSPQGHIYQFSDEVFKANYEPIEDTPPREDPVALTGKAWTPAYILATLDPSDIEHLCVVMKCKDGSYDNIVSHVDTATMAAFAMTLQRRVLRLMDEGAEEV